MGVGRGGAFEGFAVHQIDPRPWVSTLMLGASGLASVAHFVTVAILAQGTSWAVAVTQAFFVDGSIPANQREGGK